MVETFTTPAKGTFDGQRCSQLYKLCIYSTSNIEQDWPNSSRLANSSLPLNRSNASSLCVSDVDLAPSLFLEWLSFLNIPNMDIELEDLRSPITVSQLVDILGAPQCSVFITGCNVTRLPTYEGALALMRIPVNRDLIPILRSFRGPKLSLNDCPGFHDRVLEMMIQHSRSPCAPQVHQLDISNCPYLSVAMLKRFIETTFGIG